MYTRRKILDRGVRLVAAAGTVTILPFSAHADSHEMGANMFETNSGEIRIHPVSHASFVMETPAGVIYCDPVGDASAYSGFPAPDLILITHEHGDHYNADTLAALAGDDTKIITNPAVFDMLPEGLKAKAESIANGGSTTFGDVAIDAIPAYNTTEERLNFHPQGRDNGYVLTIDGSRVYIAGDTEDIPEMRALEDIDIAFVPMNLPFTMDINQAASAVSEFKPTHVYPYHYRGRDMISDVEEFASLVAERGSDVDVILGKWY